MKQLHSAILAIVGGIIDLIAGFVLVQPTLMMGAETIMAQPTSLFAGYLLIGLGILVLLTGLYLLSARMMPSRTLTGRLVLLYGVIMLILGVSMLGQLFPMMQGSRISGTAMLIVGLAML